MNVSEMKKINMKSMGKNRNKVKGGERKKNCEGKNEIVFWTQHNYKIWIMYFIEKKKN